MLTLACVVYYFRILPETNKLVIESGDSAQKVVGSGDGKEQWNDTFAVCVRSEYPRRKSGTKADAAFDSRDKCEQSASMKRLTGPNTLRCLDRRTDAPVRLTEITKKEV
ncbi:DUF1283 domain-containing protein [Salmonella enterica subsp. enterica]|nr:DUF1283 domain-containing protein [Salmonella enterica subsp. enterica]